MKNRGKREDEGKEKIEERGGSEEEKVEENK
jgi:hypothetical protein